MALAVGADQENKLVGIPLGAGGTVRGVVTEPGCGVEKFLSFCAAFEKVIDGTLGRAETIGGLEGLRSLNLIRAIGDTTEDGGVDGDDIAVGGGRSDHYLFNEHAADEIFGCRDVFHALSDGPTIGCRLETPLSGGEILRGIQDTFLAGLEKLESFVFVGLRKFLAANGE